jgi:hypothetical protein
MPVSQGERLRAAANRAVRGRSSTFGTRGSGKRSSQALESMGPGTSGSGRQPDHAQDGQIGHSDTYYEDLFQYPAP